jgi:hypothetical protein
MITIRFGKHGQLRINEPSPAELWALVVVAAASILGALLWKLV